MSENTKTCPVCNSEAEAYRYSDRSSVFWVCPVCGRFEITMSEHEIVNHPHLASFLFYRGFHDDGNEYRYHTTLSKEQCDEFNRRFEDGDRENGRPVHMDVSTIEAWYPKTFAERIDQILLYLYSKTKHIGQSVFLEGPELCALLFIDQIEDDSFKRRDRERWASEVVYWINYLRKEELVESELPNTGRWYYNLKLTPKGYARIEELQKTISKGRNAFVAMKYGPQTDKIREAIRKGIQDAGYNPVIMDEYQHNDSITVEMLKQIRDSRFVVVDLTYQSSGAYFEEGYAMGLGKPVIQLCSSSEKLHFDVAQRNTIQWTTEAEIPERLANRIKATIE